MNLRRTFSVLVWIFVLSFPTALVHPAPSEAGESFLTPTLSLPENLTNCTRIAFTATTYPEEQQFANIDIYTVDAAGERIQQITHAPTQEISPTWSSNGRQIAYIARRGVMVTELNGLEQYLWISQEAVDSWVEQRARVKSLTWSPTGELALGIDYYGNAGVLQFEVFVTRTGNDFQRVAQGASPSWKPDGSRLVFSFVPQNEAGNFELYQIDLETRKITRLTYQDGYDISPAWSPDGSRIAFISTRHDPYTDLPESYKVRELYVMNADGSHVARLTDDDVMDGSPTWSPDGEWIAFRHGADLYVIRVDGTQMHKLVDAERIGGQIDTPVWSPWLCEPLDLDREPTPWAKDAE